MHRPRGRKVEKTEASPRLPLCKEQDFQMMLNRNVERKISSLRVYCLKKSQGCRWEGELGSLNHHMHVKEGDCAFVEVECEFSEMGCTTMVMRKDLPKHMEESTHKHIILMSVLGSKTGGGSLESSRKLQEQRAEMLQMQLFHRDQEFQQRLEGLEKKLEMKSEELADVEQKLKVKDQELANIGERLKNRDDQLAEVKGQLQEKDQQLSKIEEQVREKEGHLSVVEKKLEEREKQLISVEQHLKEKDKEQAEVKRNLEEKEQHIQELRNSLQRKEEQDDVKRKLQEQRDEMKQQLQMSEKDLKQRIVELEKRLHDKDKRLEKELGAQITSLKADLNVCCPLPFDFIMLNFAELKANSTEWYSPPFYTHPGGYRLSLRVEANGYGSKKGNSVSWCFCTEPGEYDGLLQWPRRYNKCSIQLLNHYTGKWDRNLSCANDMFRKPAPARQCTNCWHSVAYSDLECDAQKKTHYLKDDCLYFRILK